MAGLQPLSHWEYQQCNVMNESPPGSATDRHNSLITNYKISELVSEWKWVHSFIHSNLAIIHPLYSTHHRWLMPLKPCQNKPCEPMHIFHPNKTSVMINLPRFSCVKPTLSRIHSSEIGVVNAAIFRINCLCACPCKHFATTRSLIGCGGRFWWEAEIRNNDVTYLLSIHLLSGLNLCSLWSLSIDCLLLPTDLSCGQCELGACQCAQLLAFSWSIFSQWWVAK